MTKKNKLLNALYDLYGSSNVKDYKYMGGAYYSTHYDSLSKNSTFVNVHYNYLLRLMNDNKELADSVDIIDIEHSEEFYKCVCKQTIKQRCFIIKRDKPMIYKNFIIIGNCCIKLFYHNEMKRECSKCNNKHRNTKDNYCNSCRNIIKLEKKKLIHSEAVEEVVEKVDKQLIYNQYLFFFNNSYELKIGFGKYKNHNIYDFLNDKDYTNWLYDKCKDNIVSKYYFNLNTGYKIFCNIEYISNILKYLHTEYPDEFISDDIEYYC